MDTRVIERATDIINTYKAEGFDSKQIKDFLCDGEALAVEGFTDEDQDAIDYAYDLIP